MKVGDMMSKIDLIKFTDKKDNNVIQRIRELFPKCYICNLDGIVI